MYSLITVFGFNFHGVIYRYILLLKVIILQLHIMGGCYCMKTFILSKSVDSRTPRELQNET